MGNYAHATEYLTLGESLLTSILLKVKVHVNSLLNVLNLQNISSLK